MNLFNIFKLQRLDKYIIKKFLGTYIFSLFLIIVVIVIFDYNEKIDKFVSSNAPMNEIIFDYYVNLAPYYANTFSALFVFISVIYFTSKMADNSEIIAILSAGISFRRLMKPYMIAAGIISLVTYVMSAFVIPNGTASILEFEQKYNKRKKTEAANDIQFRIDNNSIAL